MVSFAFGVFVYALKIMETVSETAPLFSDHAFSPTLKNLKGQAGISEKRPWKRDMQAADDSV
jgi:hypothetical protein